MNRCILLGLCFGNCFQVFGPGVHQVNQVDGIGDRVGPGLRSFNRFVHQVNTGNPAGPRQLTRPTGPKRQEPGRKSKRAERLAQHSTAQPEKAKNLNAKFQNSTPQGSI